MQRIDRISCLLRTCPRELSENDASLRHAIVLENIPLFLRQATMQSGGGWGADAGFPLVCWSLPAPVILKFILNNHKKYIAKIIVIYLAFTMVLCLVFQVAITILI